MADAAEQAALLAYLRWHGAAIGRRARAGDPLCAEIVALYTRWHGDSADTATFTALTHAVDRYRRSAPTPAAYRRYLRRQQLKNGRALLPVLPAALPLAWRSRARRHSAAAVRAVARRTTPADPGHKYARHPWRYWLENATRLPLLGLSRAAPQRVLDLGCGPGYFVALCREAGHAALGLDVPGTAVYDALTAALGVERVERVIRPNERFSAELGPFDLITAFSIDFDEVDDRVWTVDEWAFFMDDARSLLRPDGRLCLRFNLAKYRAPSLAAQPLLWRAVTDAPGFAVTLLNHRDVLLQRVPRRTP